MDQMANQIIDIDTATEKIWDITIIGGGMGGGIIAYALTQKGFNVLMIEKGLASFEDSDHQSIVEEEVEPEKRMAAGKWPCKIRGTVDQKGISIWPSLGCGVGGSTLLYAAALQRFDPRDFEPRKIPSGETLTWPFSYDDLSQYYEKAEKLFSVCGTIDPLRGETTSTIETPPAMSEADCKFFQAFKNSGLNPYRLHVGLKYINGCSECAGKICQHGCKQGAHNCGIHPALKTGRLEILEQSEVIRLEANDTQVTSAVVRHQGVECRTNVKTLVLSAGTLHTPIVLLRSKSSRWPNGLGNDSGLVGKNLMFHATDFIAFWPPSKSSFEGPNKTIAFRDFYFHDETKLGEVQSTGLFAGYGNVLYALRLMFDQSKFRKLPLLRQFLRIPAYIASKLFGKASIFATILEDMPYPENHVFVDEEEPSGMSFNYKVHRELKDRYFMFRKILRKKISNLKSMPMYVGVNLNYGHPSGTCRAGTDPKTSVLNEDCRSHSVHNLYIVDGSFMPTSGGTNPSLTIAANALRVADKIEKQLRNN